MLYVCFITEELQKQQNYDPGSEKSEWAFYGPPAESVSIQ